MPKKKRASPGITPEVLLDHMRGMEDRLHTVFKREIGTSEVRLGERIGRVEMRLENVETRLDRMETGIEWIKSGISNMDERLDDIEVAQIPKLKKAVGMR